MKYYYLISSLPELQIEDPSHSQEQLSEILDLIHENLSPEDQRIYECLLLMSDNQNLLYILFREYHDFKIRHFVNPSYYPIEVLENYRREYHALPDYMINYLNDNSGSFSSLTLRDMEHSLNQYFYDHVGKLDSPFLQTYFQWRFQLKRTIANVNVKAYPFLNTQSETTEPFFPDVRSLPGLISMEDVSTQISPLIEQNNLEKIERKVDEYYWNFADCWQEPFSVDFVFAYVLKLIHLYRWKGFAAKGELAKEKFENLINELKEKTSSPKMPLV